MMMPNGRRLRERMRKRDCNIKHRERERERGRKGKRERGRKGENAKETFVSLRFSIALAFFLRHFSEIGRLQLDFRNSRLIFIEYKNV